MHPEHACLLAEVQRIGTTLASDVSPTGMAETQRLCEAAGLPQGLRVTAHVADVSDAAHRACSEPQNERTAAMVALVPKGTSPCPGSSPSEADFGARRQ